MCVMRSKERRGRRGSEDPACVPAAETCYDEQMRFTRGTPIVLERVPHDRPANGTLPDLRRARRHSSPRRDDCPPEGVKHVASANAQAPPLCGLGHSLDRHMYARKAAVANHGFAPPSPGGWSVRPALSPWTRRRGALLSPPPCLRRVPDDAPQQQHPPFPSREARGRRAARGESGAADAETTRSSYYHDQPDRKSVV